MNSSSNRYIWVLLTLFALSVLQSCNPSTEEKDSIFPTTWQGEWTGVQPDYPMRDAQGNVIYIRGQEALVKSSTFVFSIQEGGNIQLTQSIDDGRVMEFQGRWNAIPSMMQMDSKTFEITDGHSLIYLVQFSCASDSPPRPRRLIQFYGNSRKAS